tara:strand:+ start:5761 stop:5910 length:150 start_codon:yes stop_codon:yes gene_type:complete
MRTQRHDLKQEIRELESELRFAVINLDIFSQIAINVRLEDARTLLYNIQ